MDNMSKPFNAANAPRVLIVAAGTGGHIFPALAVAEELIESGAEVLWLGIGGMERRLVEKRGFPLYIVPFSSPSGLVGLIRLGWAVARACVVLLRVRPAVVLGMGGYASAPGCLAAWLLRVPVLIHEQNAVAGRANRLLARFVAKKLTGFPDVFSGGIWVGNPVRQGFAPAPKSPSAGGLRLLVLGGSQGAQALNTVVPAAAALLAKAGQQLRIKHQCGAGNGEAVNAAYKTVDVSADIDANAEKTTSVSVEVSEFIDDVANELSAADVVVCRAGASTLAELTAVAAAAVLVPYPTAAADHQTANATFFAKKQAAVLCVESELTPTWLANFLQEAKRENLQAMGERCAALAMPAAAANIANYCLKEAKHAS